MTQDDWAERFTGRIAKEIERRRTHSPSGKLSAQWLSDRTHELGHRVGRSRISDLETGRRKRMDITELIVLAEALDVPPVELLFPGLMTDQCEFLPGQFTTAWNSLKRFTGEHALGGIAMRDQREYHLSLMREWDRNTAQLIEAMNNRSVAQSAGDYDRVQFEESRIETARRHDELLKDTIRAAGYKVSGKDE